MPSESSMRLIERVRAQLEPDGWGVNFREGGEPLWVDVRVSHPLSSSHGFVFPDGDSEKKNADFIEKCLLDEEFSMMRERPIDCPHASLIGSLRVMAAVNGWHPDMLAMVARVLRADGVLTDEEATWLEDAGPARWTPEGHAQHPRRWIQVGRDGSVINGP